MAKKLRVVIAQLNLLVGDIEANLTKHLQAAKTARDIFKADVIVFPELSLTGYPPEDLLLRKYFIDAAHQALYQLKDSLTDIYCVVGHPHATEQGLVNACSLIYNGTILGRYAKQHLPNYDVFDECRYFIPGNAPCVLPIRGIPVGLVICEDLWSPSPVQQAATQGARLILSPNASPFESNKHEQRVATLHKRAKLNRVPVIYVNQLGGQDELIFDGGSLVINEEGQLRQLVGFSTEALHPVDIDITSTHSKIDIIPFHLPSEEEKLYNALVLGVRDYVEKNHFPGVLLGVSGGIDSALTLAIAVDALGPHRVSAVFMPSRYTADISAEDAKAIAEHLKVSLETFPLEPAYKTFLATLATAFAGKKTDTTEENIQSRCRAVILMALSNKTGRLVLTTGNRSEMAVGYATIYGDMAGGLAVLQDVPKTMVYCLAHYRNQINPVIPERTLLRPPTAELAADQKDEDSLPPYATLDKMLELYLNREQSLEDLVSQGFHRETVAQVIQLIRRNEYKRRQAAVGIRLNLKSFGKGRRYPLTSGFKG
jgi:NAD+ synthase (glutamine-hydrolysing)